MIDYDPHAFLWQWRRAPLRKWLIGLGSFAVILAAVYFIFSALGR